MATDIANVPPTSNASSLTPPATIDGTGLTTSVPLLIKNAKTNSGVEVQVTGTAASGFVINNSSGTAKAAFGFAVSANDWITGTAAGDTVIACDTAKKLGIGGLGGAALLISFDPTTSAVTMGSAAKLLLDSNTSSTSVALQINGDPNTGIKQSTDGADSLSIVTGGSEIVRFNTAAASTGITLFGSVAMQANKVFRFDSAASLVAVAMQVSGDPNTGVAQVGGADTLGLVAGGVEIARAGADLIISPAGALATNATTGFLRLPTCAGTPTGAATNGAVVLDTTGGKLWLRIGGAWVGGTVPGAFV